MNENPHAEEPEPYEGELDWDNWDPDRVAYTPEQERDDEWADPGR